MQMNRLNLRMMVTQIKMFNEVGEKRIYEHS